MSSPPSDASVAAFRALLVPWYRRHARDLPWRRHPTPWRVWVSEIMLQQTRVEAVVPYYERFVRRFPTVEALAAASEDEVLAAWSGLGYYRRARSLRAGAIAVRDRFGGRFPPAEEDALALPGIGRYTAGAIRSIALGLRAPIVDGNVARVLARVFGLRGVPTKAPLARILWDLAGRVVAEGDPPVVNQAQMEIGALVCTPADPGCAGCPLAGICVARRDGLVDELPERAPRRATVEVERVVLVVRSAGHVLLRRRKDDELLPGLWDLPGAFTGTDGDRSTGFEDAAALLPFEVKEGIPLGRVKHAITYRRITLDVRSTAPARATARRCRGRDGAELRWLGPAEADAEALSSPARRILRRWGEAFDPGALDTPAPRPVC